MLVLEMLVMMVLITVGVVLVEENVTSGLKEFLRRLGWDGASTSKNGDDGDLVGGFD